MGFRFKESKVTYFVLIDSVVLPMVQHPSVMIYRKSNSFHQYNRWQTLATMRNMHVSPLLSKYNVPHRNNSKHFWAKLFQLKRTFFFAPQIKRFIKPGKYFTPTIFAYCRFRSTFFYYATKGIMNMTRYWRAKRACVCERWHAHHHCRIWNSSK